MSRVRQLVCVLVLCFLVLPSGVLPVASAAPVGPTRTLTGTLYVVWGDGAPGAGLASETRFLLAQPGGATIELPLDVASATIEQAGGVLALNRQPVVVEVQDTSDQSLLVSSIGVEPAMQQPVAPQAVTGTSRWVSILCRFADTPGVTPQPLAWFPPLFSNTKPGMDHYWQEQSFGQLTIAGSVVVGWYTLPQPRSYYVTGDTFQFERATNDCAARADAAVHFPNFDGINFMFNGELNGYAYGGGTGLSLDGVDRGYRATWLPVWGYENQSVLGHEMGHGFGLPHSSGPYTETYDSQWDVMSSTWRCDPPDAVYGCVGQHTIAFHKSMLGWIAAARTYVAGVGGNQQIELQRLARPVSGTRKHIARIPIPGSPSRFYTVEARTRHGYDVNLPGEGVVIHLIDTDSYPPARVVDIDNNGDPNDAAAIWTPGETFADVAQRIYVRVNAATTGGYSITIFNQTAPPTPAVPTLEQPDTDASFAENEPVTLAWSSTASEYQVEISGGPGGTITTGWRASPTYTPGLIAPGSTYAWRVRGRISTALSAWSTPQQFHGVASAPEQLDAQAVSCASVQLTWRDVSKKEGGYRVFRNGVAVGTDRAVNATSYRDSGLSPETLYTYEIRAVNGTLLSAPSNAVELTTPACTTDDSVPPVVNWISPALNDGSYVAYSGVITLKVRAVDNVGVQSVEFMRWNATTEEWLVLATDTAAPYQMPLDMGSLSVGGTFYGAFVSDVSGYWTFRNIHIARNDFDAPVTRATRSPIPNGAGWSRSALTITLTATDNARGSGVAEIVYAADGAQPIFEQTVPGASTDVTFTEQGVTDLAYFSRDALGNDEWWNNLIVKIDTTLPTVTVPIRSLPSPVTVDATDAQVALRWTGADAVSGVARYELQQSTNSGAYAPVVLANATVPNVTLALAPSAAYRFRVRAIDQAGNTSAWAVGASFRLDALQESGSGVNYTGAWSNGSLSGAWGGAVAFASASGRSVHVQFTGTSVAWITATGPDRGRAAVYLDGRAMPIRTVSLYSATLKPRRAIVALNNLAPGAHTIEIRVLGTKAASSSGTRVDIDGFVFLR